MTDESGNTPTETPKTPISIRNSHKTQRKHIMVGYLDEPYETSEEMDELREIKKRLSLEYLARTPEEQERHDKEFVNRLKPKLTTATFV